MRKLILISIGILLWCTALQAQKKYVYEDSTLYQEEEKIYTKPTLKDEAVSTSTEIIEKPVEEVADTIYVDTTVYYNQLEVPADSIKAWKNLKAFGYVSYLDSLLKAQKENKKKAQKYETPSGPGALDRLLSSPGLKVILWMLAALFIGFIIYKLFLTEGAFRKKTTASKMAPEVEEEIITQESDFEKLIRLALQSGNYRLAVRYQYLQTLHKLAAKNIIELAADKTNNNYVRELTNKNYQQDFAALTLNYEYVWYGEFAIDENIYRRLATDFLQFNNKI